MSSIEPPVLQKNNFKPKKLIGIRHLQFFLLFFTLIVSFIQRSSLSVAIVAMMEETPPDPSIPTYPNWSHRDAILSSFLWGYIAPQIGAGQLSEYFGPKWFLAGTMGLGSIFNILVPVMAEELNEGGVMACRIIQGLNQGFLFPCIHNLISRWSPLYERSTVLAFIYSGTSLGTVVAMPISGAIAGSRVGWPAIFYCFGGVGLVWAVILGILTSDSPLKHSRVSEEEKNYINNGISITSEKKLPTPWKHIVTSVPMWAILVALLGESWGYFTLLTEIPTYMNSIMIFDIKSNGLLSAVPYLVLFLVCLVAGPAADKLISSKTLSIGATRKVANAIGTMVPAVALFSLGFIQGPEKELATTLLVIAVAATAFNYSGSYVNTVDLAPNHAGTLNGITNGAAIISSILAPLTVGFFGDEKENPVLWKKVFWLASGIYVISGSIYLIFASGEVQNWNDLREDGESTYDIETNGKKS